MTIHLSEQDEAKIHERVASGRYRDVDEAVHAAIGLLDELDAEIAWLNDAIDPAQEQFDQGLGAVMTAERFQELVALGIRNARGRRQASDAAAS